VTSKKIESYGSWNSPITAELIASGGIRLLDVETDGDDVYWLEMRPADAARYVVSHAGDPPTDITPAGFSARTLVHEYGGGSFRVFDGVCYFANLSDQRIYRQEPGADPASLTPESALRFADFDLDTTRDLLIAVSEDHTSEGQEATNRIVSIRLNTATVSPAVPPEPQTLVEGADFYSNPRLSADGRRLAWLSWDHPNMPWDGTELWVADIAADGRLSGNRLVSGGNSVSLFQPEWSPDGELYFVSDRTGWWNLYRERDGEVQPVLPMDTEFGLPQWAFRMSTYAFFASGQIACAFARDGRSTLATLDPESGKLTEIDSPYSSFSSIRTAGNDIVLLGSSATHRSAVVRLNLESGQVTELKRSSETELDPDFVSIAEPITFPTENDREAHAFYYAPTNPDYAPPPNKLPPLIVHSHGGPTGAAVHTLSLSVQFWTSRGIAVVDVNYGGSTGHGREYRERLNGTWGIIDVEDCANAARYLVERGDVDGNRLAISGGSAGGWTTLCALTFTDLFHAGVSHFGVSDAGALARDTHKFESRYLDGLIGPYPEREDLYRERSPIDNAERLSCPVIFLQGLEDRIVPPDQSARMAAAIRDKGIPVALLEFPGEQHGFRRAENVKRALEAELHFYGRVLKFIPADEIEPVTIDNLAS